MSTDRATLLKKTFKTLKKHYKSVEPHSSYTILEHMLFACCLEGAKHEAAEEAYAILQQKYFDWNEVRVTAIGELAELLTAVPDSHAAARRVFGVLQSMFESHYTFDLEFLRKQNQGKTVKELSAHRRITPFVINYLVQCGLGGHSIPLSSGAFEVLFVLGAISEKDQAAQRAPGLERTIAKNQGIEFGSLLHQLAVDYTASRHSTRVRAILMEIAPDCKERLPKRGGAKKTAKPKKKVETKAEKGKTATRSKTKAAETKTKTEKKATKKAETQKPAKKKATAKKAATQKSGAKKTTASKKAAAKTAKKATKKSAKTAKKKAVKKAVKKTAKSSVKKKKTTKKSSRIKKPR